MFVDQSKSYYPQKSKINKKLNNVQKLETHATSWFGLLDTKALQDFIVSILGLCKNRRHLCAPDF